MAPGGRDGTGGPGTAPPRWRERKSVTPRLIAAHAVLPGRLPPADGGQWGSRHRDFSGGAASRHRHSLSCGSVTGASQVDVPGGDMLIGYGAERRHEVDVVPLHHRHTSEGQGPRAGSRRSCCRAESATPAIAQRLPTEQRRVKRSGTQAWDKARRRLVGMHVRRRLKSFSWPSVGQLRASGRGWVAPSARETSRRLKQHGPERSPPTSAVRRSLSRRLREAWLQSKCHRKPHRSQPAWSFQPGDSVALGLPGFTRSSATTAELREGQVFLSLRCR